MFLTAPSFATLALDFGLGPAPRFSHFALDVHPLTVERAGAVWKPNPGPGNTPLRAHARAGVGLNCAIGVALEWLGVSPQEDVTGRPLRLAGQHWRASLCSALLASEVAHAPLLAPDNQVGVIIADLDLLQRAALAVDVAHDRGCAVLAAGGGSRRITTITASEHPSFGALAALKLLNLAALTLDLLLLVLNLPLLLLS